MHQALLIDEILEAILDNCSDWNRPEYHQTLTQVARSCKAWRDPALDRLWKRLEDIGPLLAVAESNDSSVTQVKNHAERVRHISFKKQPSPSSLESCGVLPNLSSLSLVDAGCELPLSWVSSHADSLRDMHIRIAPLENPSLLDSRCSHVSRLLEQIPSTSLRTLNVRGFLTPALNLAIARHTFLRELTFLSGFYISPELLGAITAMPYLKKLRCHATVMESAQLEPFLPRTQPTFPSLTSIHFVGKPSVIHTLVDLLPAGQLESVTLEAYRPPRADASFWRSIIETLSAKASDTLTQLDIYHTIEQDDIDVGPLLALDSSFTLDILRPLSRCIHLHQFTLGCNTPYAITDKDLDSLVAGWPDISILRLDTSLFANHIRPSKMTVASLDMLARRCPKLRVLSIPLDISAPAPAPADDKSAPRPPTVQRTLNSLYVKYSQEARHVSPFIEIAIRIFPGMEELELESFDDQVVWDCTSGKASFTYAGAADGLADGQ